MSEEMDLNTNNLCTTEDAFEQFQAISMYTENEFITLTEIVTPQPETANPTSELNEIPYQNEIVLESRLEDQVCEVNSTIESGSEENKPAEISPQLEEPASEIHNEAPVETHRPKRQRKKKNQSDVISSNHSTSIEQRNGTQKSVVADSPLTSSPVTQKRRGRKPKNKYVNLFGNSKDSSNDNIDCNDATPVLSTSCETEIEIEIVSEIQNTTPSGTNSVRRKGREKKQSNLVRTKDENIAENTKCANISSQKPKRGRPRKSLPVNQSSKEVEVIETDLTQLQHQSPQHSDNINDELPMIDMNIPLGNSSVFEVTVIKEDPDKIGDEDDEADDITLSNLKKTLEPKDSKLNINYVVQKSENVETESNIAEDTDTNNDLESQTNEQPNKRNSKKPTMTDFEYNIDSIVGVSSEHKKNDNNETDETEKPEESLLVEDTSKRPVRRKAKQTMHYEEESDEDPYANMESSEDDEPKRGKKGTKYYSDDEYIPGVLKRGNVSSSDISDIDDEVDDLIKQRKKKKRLDTSFDKTSKKRRKKPNLSKEAIKGRFSPEVQTIVPNASTKQDDDIEICLQSSVIKTNEDSNQKLGWGANSEFKNFIAKKIQGTDIKITKATSVQPLEIPVLDPKLAKKTVEVGAQTTTIKTNSIEIQTSVTYDVPMKDNVKLTAEQSKNACEFLNGIVKTTAELGQLMTQKSEDFIKKKINSDHVTDTFKMDYCVRKSFLLFKLAKHNLMQMEEDLAKQYDEFLSHNNLTQYREKPKVLIGSSSKTQENDSDCEIIEEPVVQKSKVPKVNPKFNPKTVFLNKELSIKIAKKPSKVKNLNIKNPHTVWINDSVMVKKVKPTQSFLAQDSRNKKPPDCVSIKMVEKFFEEFYRQQALITCAPFLSTEWLSLDNKYECRYFFTKPDDFSASSLSSEIPSGSGLVANTANIVTESKNKNCEPSTQIHPHKSPRTLFSLCTQILQKHLYLNKSYINITTSTDMVTDTGYIHNPQTLQCLCVNKINLNITKNNKIMPNLELQCDPLSLKTSCLKKINDILFCTHMQHQTENGLGYLMELEHMNIHEGFIGNKNVLSANANSKASNKTLFSLCVEYYQTAIGESIKKSVLDHNNVSKIMPYYTPNTLKHIAYKCITKSMYGDFNDFQEKNQLNGFRPVKTLFDLSFETVSHIFTHNKMQPKECLTINSVNTLTEEAYLSIEPSHDLSDNLEYYDGDETDFYEDETEDFATYNDVSHTEENNWISQVQMKELRSCFVPNVIKKTSDRVKNIQTNELALEQESIITQIKIEPEEEPDNIVDTSVVKTEPVNNLDEMTIIPESIITKSEAIDHIASEDQFQRRNSSSYDVDTFEAFVSTNKMMHALNDSEDFFSQSTSRIRRQHEPDSDPENDMSMSLLVPQTYEPMHVENAKHTLMESSGDENNINKKNVSKKKQDRRKTKVKKTDIKTDKLAPEKTASKEDSKEKSLVTNEVTLLTRRMRDKLRQEEKKVVSSDSENEDVPLGIKKDKEKNILSKKSNEDIYDNSKTLKSTNEAIQCNNVDSTEQINENLSKSCASPDPTHDKFPGFCSSDQSDISNYQKYLKFLSEKVDASMSGSNELENKSDIVEESPVINPDDPVELLECEPMMPVFDNEDIVKISKRKSKGKVKDNKLSDKRDITLPYTERYGWNCYPLDCNDTKLYLDAQILLEKLPESFVEIYFQFQNISNRNEEDEQVERLINLQTLNRSLKECKSKTSGKRKVVHLQDQSLDDLPGSSSKNSTRTESPINSECYDELSPSDDEDDKIDDNIPSPLAKERASENNIAKDSLMDENDSEEEDEENKVKVKTEPKQYYVNETTAVKKFKPCPKSKKKMLEPTDTESLMLTADKMMNKELNLLHAPVVLDDSSPITPIKGPVTRNKAKSVTKTSNDVKQKIKNDDNSSSEEEKQWFTIKEKLLKKMINKTDTSREDDAKRAKLVSEFIERRGEQTENYLKRRSKIKGRRSTKKMLERQKQLKVLSCELFGDPANDPSHQGKTRYTQTSLYKGRRNIRKVIDKKSLAKDTVVANMEEFERKRRLNIKHNKLREILRCEEGVNVLVINDEVCLEYDFEQRQPIVTIHSFFTRVMKAHQYEGVKFMWDACFESLDKVASGDGGGGCILAHCMGLGKTLQVLALLHTVLTHPRVGMQRVLVCCPLSTVLNWVDEIHKWIGPVTDKIKVFELSKLKKTYERAYQLEDWYNGGGIFIIGYELFRSLTTLDPYLDDVRPTIINKIRTALLDPGPDIIICDEGHLLKNDCSVLAVAMSRVVTKRRIVLTGTPMQNNLREYYCMVNFIKPNLLGTYAEYSNRFENPIMNGQHRDSREEDIKLMKARTHILHKVLEGCLQRQEASVLYPYLPKKHEYTVFISLTKCQWDLYKHYMQNYANKQSNKSVLKDFHILQKIWSHPQVLHNFQTRTMDQTKNKVKIEKLEDDLATEDLNADLNPSEDLKPSDREVWWLQYLEGGEMLESLQSSNKFVAIFRILDECIALGDKLLIFSTSLFTMDALEYFLKKINKWSLGHEYYRLDGSVPPEVRQKWCREFNADNNHKTKLFLISTRAGSLGLNMTAANRVIILDTSWNPAHDIQSIFRVYRFGQKKDCFIYRLVALGTMEQKIYERSVTKQAVACRVLDEQQIDRHYNMADLTELYRYDETGISVAGGVAVGVEDVVLLRVARDANLHAVHEHDSLLRGSGEQGLPEHERNAAWMQFQQEHAHKQMQNELEREYENSKTTLKHIHGHDYALPPSLKPIIKVEKDENPKETKAELKSRKSKKKSVVNCSIPIQPASSFIDFQESTISNQDNEEEMVKQISDILVKHNFHYRQEPKEISSLVANVRKIVESGRMETLASADDLTNSIAKVLLQKDLPKPALTDIVCESVNVTMNDSNSPMSSGSKETRPKDTGSTSKINKPKKSKQKKGYVYEEIVSDSANVQTVEIDGRKKRRAALAAEKSFDAITHEIIDLDNDDSDTDFVPKDKLPSHILPDIQSKVKLEPTESSCEKKGLSYYKTRKSAQSETKEPVETDTKKKKSTKTILETKQKDDHCVDNSILLSDEEPLLPKKPGPERKTISTAQIGEKVNETDENEPKEEVVPLHPTLLSNQNFIKIVAHTYLTGNPMLDEDAATLAAQYSTQKALKEYESTGKNIESGALYNIALKVLGVDVLKKLNAAKPPIPTTSTYSVTPKASDDNSNNVSSQIVKEKTPEPVKPVEPKKPIKLTIKIPSEGSMMKPIVTSSSVAHIPTPTSVVPVGMFMGVDEFSQASQSADECILPDDDIRIITNPPPPILEKRNSQKILLNSVLSESTKSSETDFSDAPLLRSKTIIQPILVPLKKYNQSKTNLGSTSNPSTTRVNLGSTSNLITTRTNLGSTSNSITTRANLNSTLNPITTRANLDSTSNPTTTRANLGSTSNPITTSNAPECILSDLNNTIFLDSDEEEEITPVQKAKSTSVYLKMIHGQPVPVSLTKVDTPQLTTIPSNSNKKEIIPIKKTLEVASNNKKIVLIPQSKLSKLSKAAGNTTVVKVPKIEQNKITLAAVPPTPVNKTVVLTDMTEPKPELARDGKFKKRMCMPGDILRITKTGDIEVVNRKDQTATVTKPPIIPETDTKTKSLLKENLTTLKESTSKDSTRIVRPKSPFDPLSILKNVVHIEADDYGKRTSVKTKEPPVTKSATVVNSSATKETTAGKKSTGVISATICIDDPPEGGKFHNILSRKSIKNTTLDTIIVPTENSSTASKAGKKSNAMTGKNKLSNEIIITSVDLTDIESTKIIKRNPTRAKSSKISLIGSTLVGTSKDIIISGAGFSKTTTTGNANKINQSAPIIDIDMVTAEMEAKKRPAPPATTSAKKKKTDKPMTLKDFDIDDIDDIIELE